jgi:D-alanyl-lipoteichoic acid acyltransferase DltB (MBOAT superfamily)
MLLIASCTFYMFFIPVYILILAITILIDYFAGMLIEQSEGKKRKIYLVVSIISTCLVLFIFKYFNFFNANFASIADFFHLNYPIEFINIILPIGLSFHTFQSLSYVIEVYRRKQKAEKNFGIYSLYVMFYPQLVAGPIERPQNLLHQFYEKHNFDYRRVVDGLKLMAWGLFKKVVIADRLAIAVNQVYGNPSDYSSFQLAIATVFFAFQIYCDFSGYSDMAIGAAKVMGFKLMKNFNLPYFSKSISEFWKRWHISLSTWFRDYLYISLGGNRVVKWRWYFNLFITFTISGLWHGANWTFVIWGALNGFYLVFAIWTEGFKKKVHSIFKTESWSGLYSFVQIVNTFVLTCIAWVFFRAKDVDEAFYILTHMFRKSDNTDIFITNGKFTNQDFIFSVVLILFLSFVSFHQRNRSIIGYFLNKPMWLRYTIYLILVLSIFYLGVFEETQFIYFQF